MIFRQSPKPIGTFQAVLLMSALAIVYPFGTSRSSHHNPDSSSPPSARSEANQALSISDLPEISSPESGSERTTQQDFPRGITSGAYVEKEGRLKTLYPLRPETVHPLVQEKAPNFSSDNNDNDDG